MIEVDVKFMVLNVLNTNPFLTHTLTPDEPNRGPLQHFVCFSNAFSHGIANAGAWRPCTGSSVDLGPAATLNPKPCHKLVDAPFQDEDDR